MSNATAHYAGHDTAAGSLASVEEVVRLVAEHARPGDVQRQPLADSQGRVLAKAVIAPIDLPAWNKTMMDGYAVRAADCTTVPVELRVVGAITAGESATRPLQPGEAMRINTGAPLPAGADAVVMHERAELLDKVERIRLREGVRTGQHVVQAGSYCRAGQIVLDAGVRLGAAQVGAAAAVGSTEIEVYSRPCVALLPTGNEVVAGGGVLKPGQIHESNGPALAALGEHYGAEMVHLGICRDEREALKKACAAGLACPILVVVGGMSMGTLDLVPGVLAELGVRWRVHGVDMRPGRPMGYGVGPAGQQVFGLPGNPASCFACFCLFVKPAIDGWMGLPAQPRVMWNARLTRELKASRDPRPAYLPARLSVAADGVAEVEPVTWQGSGDAVGLGRADALVHQPAGGAAVAAGAMVRVMKI